MKTLTRYWAFTFATLVLCFAVLTGCGITNAKENANKVLTRHFQTISTNGFDEALAGYGNQFFQKTTKDEWSKALARLTSKLGTYQNHTITGWRAFTQAGTFGAGTTVTLQCQVNYSKHSAQETFTLFKGVTDSDYKIIAHQIDGAALLTE
ncbi:MAG TPA: hypothetical protein VNZ64_27410 [Candidatus Acidoferrum sp.]|jgi:hypothetical protein|nr:hypothetical protein [Candidatus Acidoferrum sp.]